jgi:hypothetical protein
MGESITSHDKVNNERKNAVTTHNLVPKKRAITPADVTAFVAKMKKEIDKNGKIESVIEEQFKEEK